MFPFNKIYKQAWELTKTNKFLWPFGLFLVLGYIAPLSNKNQNDLREIDSVVSIAVVLLIASFLLLIYFRVQAALIVGAKALLDKQHTSVTMAFRAGRFFYGRILGVSLLLEVSTLILGAIILGAISSTTGAASIILWIFGLAILVPVVVMIVLIKILAPLYIVVYDLKIMESVDRSYALIEKFWPRLILFGICLMLLQMIPLFLSIFVVGLVGGIWLKIAVASAFLLIQTPIAVFQQAAWLLLFLELIKPQKLSETEVVTAPEIAS